MKNWFSNIRGDAEGGIVSALLAIPLTVGYGMFAFVSLGEGYFASGAIAGIFTGFILCIVAVVLGDRSTTVYAPRVNTTFFLGIFTYGLIHGGSPAIEKGGVPLILAVVFSVVVLGGLIQALFGLVRLGTLIKFVPHPVMAGFQNAAAALLFLVQLANISGLDHHVSFMQMHKHLFEVRPVSVAIAALTFLTMWNSKKFLPKIPPLFVGLIAGGAVYYALLFAGFGGLLGPVIGSYPMVPLEHIRFFYFETLVRADEFAALLPTILGGAFALALIAAIDALLCAKLVTPAGEKVPDSDRLLVRMGLGNVASGLFGGITSGVNIGSSVANRSFGGRTPLSVLVHAATLIAAAVTFWWGGAYLPQTVLSACIMVIAIQHFDGWSLSLPAKLFAAGGSFRRAALLDLLVVLVVAALSVFLNIVLAVLIGIAIAVLLFVVRMGRRVVRRSYRGDNVHSRKSRKAADREFLDRAGRSILVLELQGALFFGSGETLAQEIDAAVQDGARSVILDLRRVTEIDTTAAQVLASIGSNLNRAGKNLILAVSPGTRPAARLKDFGIAAAFERISFPDVDRALEWAEDELLRGERQGTASGTEIPLERIGLLGHFTASEIAELAKRIHRDRYGAGKTVFREGEPGNDLFIVAKGTASVFIRQPAGDIRLATFSADTVFGELALFDGGKRSATVVAEDDLVCYRISKTDFAELAKDLPTVAIKLMAALGREISTRLRSANRTIHQLES